MFLLLLLAAALARKVTPVVLMHGLFSEHNTMNVLKQHIRQYVKRATGERVYIANIEIARGRISTISPLLVQLQEFAAVIRKNRELRDGFTMICHSQGNLLCRGYIEFFNDPPVRKFISLAGPNAGEFCGLTDSCPFAGRLDDLAYEIGTRFMYSEFAQMLISLSGYWQDPLHYEDYLQYNRYLAYLDNVKDYDPERARRFSSIEQWVMVGSMDDRVIEPPGSAFYNFYRPGTLEMQDMRERDVYRNDTFGLRTLDERGGVTRILTNITHSGYVRCTAIPFLEENIFPLLVTWIEHPTASPRVPWREVFRGLLGK